LLILVEYLLQKAALDINKAQKIHIMHDAITEYITDIDCQYQSGCATEHSYRPALHRLLASMMPELSVTNEPKRIECGAPDYILTKKQRPLGYIETKTIGKNLDDSEHQKQLDRYRLALSNLIVTNYTQFRFYRNTQQVAEIDIAAIKEGQGKNGQIKPQPFERAETVTPYPHRRCRTPQCVAEREMSATPSRPSFPFSDHRLSLDSVGQKSLQGGKH